MKEYIVKYVNQNPKWEDIDVMDLDNYYLESPTNIKAKAQLCYNQSALLVRLCADEKEIRAVEKGPLGEPCKDSCLEFFFCPCENDKRYFNIEFNSNCCVYVGIGKSIEDLVRLIPEEGIDNLFSPKMKITDSGWEIVYEVKYDFIKRFFPDFNISNLKSMRANFFKCADLTNPPHYLSWNPIVGENFTFHKQNCFGIIKFTK